MLMQETTFYGQTPLHGAALNDNADANVTKELIKAGADVNAKDNNLVSHHFMKL